MGCPGGTYLIFPFWANRELYCITFLRKTRHNDLFFPLQSFPRLKLKEKLTRKARVNTDRVYWVVLTPLGHPIILLKSD